MTDMMSKALAAVARGEHVFPLVQNGKDPLVDKKLDLLHGQDDASNDPDVVRDWWVHHPDANYGINLRASGLTAVDLDQHDGAPDGVASWASLAGAASQPRTKTVTTATGNGVHLVFERCPVALRGKLKGPDGQALGIDLKHNGYVVGPGSIIDGREYTATADPVLPFPRWLIEIARKPDPRIAPDGPMAGDADVLRRVHDLAAGLAQVSSGEGNDACARVAFMVGQYVGAGQLESDTAETILIRDGVGSWTYEDARHAGRDINTIQRQIAEGTDHPRAWTAPVRPKIGFTPATERPESTAEPVPAAPVRPVLPPPGFPMPVARALDTDDIRRWRGDWLRWTGTHWQTDPDETSLRELLYLCLETAQYRVEDRLKSWNPTPRSVRALMEAMEAVCRIDYRTDPGTWLDGSGKTGLISLSNTLLDPITRETLPHTRDYFVTTSLPFAYDPAAGCPRWLAFLDSAFPDDPESVALMQEWFGYVVSGRTEQQKMMFLKGAKRSGKGTTARVLNQLVGADLVAAPTLSSFGSSFGLSTLIAAPLAVIGDARSSAKIDMQSVVERMLSITGEDRLDIDRKHKAVWTGQLPTRLMMLSNEVPWFKDASGAITSRMLLLEFRQSFLGREDHALERTLATELSGIFNWALSGLDRLTTAGRFTEPAASRALMREMDEQASPIGQFVEECCVLGTDLEVDADELFKRWSDWNDGATWITESSRAARTTFGQQLRASAPGVSKDRVMRNGARRYIYSGVTLRDGQQGFGGVSR
jgi:putative DNA primase/helicase